MAYSGTELAILHSFDKRVASARERRGWSQEKLAAEAGLDRTYVGGIERGERNVALLNINKLAMALEEDLPASFLAGVAASPPDSASVLPGSAGAVLQVEVRHEEVRFSGLRRLRGQEGQVARSYTECL
jgi:transcriptional regulator with XRE-family HTH domain